MSPSAVPDDPMSPLRGAPRLARDSTARRSTNGYSLIEVLVVMVVIGVAAAFAMPSMNRVLASARVSSNANELLASLEYARAEALGRNTLVVVCRVADPRAAVPACSSAAVGGIAGNDWAAGWIVYAKPQDAVAIGNYDAATDQLLRRFEASGLRPAGERTMIVAAPAPGTIGFAGSGLRFAAAGQVPVYTIDHRDPASPVDLTLARCVTLSVVGRVRAAKVAADGSCNA
ncbi:MAG: GspH/FimT family pseudopilin [Lautropia sp.]